MSIVERKFHSTEWEGLAPLIGNAIVMGTSFLRSTAPMNEEERRELEEELAQLTGLLKKFGELVSAKAKDEDLVGQVGASGDRLREKVREFNEVMTRIVTNIVKRASH